MIGIIYPASCHSEDLSTQCCCRQNTHTCTQRQKLPRYNATNILNSSWRLSQTTTFKPPKKMMGIFIFEQCDCEGREYFSACKPN